MKKRKIFLWYLLLNKRLLKKSSFILILCAVPLLVFGMRQVAGQDNGMLKIILCQKNTLDELSTEVIRSLIENGGVLQYVTGVTEKEAREEVKNGNADAVWIFPDNLQQKIDDFSLQASSDNSIITIVEREDNVVLQLSRIKLYGALYPYISYSIYDKFIRIDLANEMTVTDAELRADYETTKVEGSLFRRAYINAEEVPENTESDNYLLLPLRGLLSLWLILCGMAASMYFIQDKELGVFSWVPVRKEIWLTYGYHLIIIGDAALVMLLALKLSGVFTTLGKELLLLFLMVLTSTAFCNLIRILCKKMQRLAVCIPLLMLAMLVLCPVFLNVHHLQPIKYLFPPFYYLNALHNVTFIYEMIIYSIVMFGLGFLSNKLFSNP